MKKYDFDAPIERNNTNSIKYDLMKKLYPGSDENTIALWVADMDFRCSDAVIRALNDRVDQAVFGYTTLDGDEEYRDSVIRWFDERYGYGIKREDIFYCPGIVPALSVAVLAYTDPGDAVLINRPVYHPFMSCIKDNGRKIVNVPLEKKDGGYILDFDRFEKAIVENDVKMYAFCSPHNPVGKVWTKDELSRIGNICRKHGVTVFSDEIHCDITRKGITHIPLDSLFEDDDFIITGTAPSKTFNIPGIALSNIIVKGSMQERWIKTIKRLHISTPGVFVPSLLKACYNESSKWYRELLVYLDDNFKLIKKYVDENIPKIRFEIPEGTYLGWMDFTDIDMGPSDLLDLFIKKGGFVIQDGRQFGKEGTGYFRINVATRRANIEKMLHSLEEIINSL